MSQTEESLLYLERQYWQLPDLDAYRKRLAALEQSLMMSWMYTGGGTPPPATNTTFSGSIKGCNGSGVEATSIVLKDATSGATLWTGASNSVGAYSGAIFLSGTTNIAADITPKYPVRLASTTGTTVATGATPGGAITLTTVTLSPTTDYHCMTLFPLPVYKILKLTDSRFGGPYTMTWGGANWTGNDGSGESYLLGTNGSLKANTSGGSPIFDWGGLTGAQTGPEAPALFLPLLKATGIGSTLIPPWAPGDTIQITE